MSFLLDNEMLPIRETTGYWADKFYWNVNYKDKSVCYVAINEVEENTCVIWSDDSGVNWFNDFPLDEQTKQIAWKNVDICHDPSVCGHCSPGKGTNKTIFGKEFNSVCLTALKFTNPDAATVECMKEIFEIRKNDILKNI